MSETTATHQAQPYPHHRDCIHCGYDLFGQPLDRPCPECGNPVATTAAQPLWTATHPRPLTRTRTGFTLLAADWLLLPLIVLFAIVSSALIPPSSSTNEYLAMCGAAATVIAGILILAGLVLIASGVSRSVWTRAIPLALAAAVVLWQVFGAPLLFTSRVVLSAVLHGSRSSACSPFPCSCVRRKSRLACQTCGRVQRHGGSSVSRRPCSWSRWSSRGSGPSGRISPQPHR